MGSITEMVNSISVEGRLVAFFKCVCVYFVWCAWQEEGAAPTFAAVAAKCAPVLCLLALLLLHHATLPYNHRYVACGRGRYVRLVAAGLALSALGDALLAWPALLVGGMAAFGGAHVSYALAFGWRGRARAWRSGALCAALAAAYCAAVRAPAGLAGCVRLYALALGGMAWRGLARGGRCAAGGVLFALSDAALGYALFVGRLPAERALVMLPYYGAQLAIAHSALRPDPPAAE